MHRITRIKPDDEGTCSAGKGIGITPEGKVQPCLSLPVECGDLTEQRFEAIWQERTPLQEMRAMSWGDLDDCSKCELRSFCNRCHAMAMIEQGQLRGASLEACRHTVARRDALRELGLLDKSNTALPPTWERVDLDGQHQLKQSVEGAGRRSPKLRVLQ